jgi:hypothetical protein
VHLQQKDEKSDNQILIDLGKTMERMLTMPENDFKSLMMNPLTTTDATGTEQFLYEKKKKRFLVG